MPLQELSLFFPCHNEAENLEALVADALAALPALAATYEVILVDDGSRDDTAGVAERLVQRHGGAVRLVRHDVNRGYGGALRSGFAAARYQYLAYTDGDRQFRVADLARLVAGAETTGAPVVIGYRLRRADPPLRLIYATLYRVANRIWFGLRVRDVDCAAKLFRRDALRGISVHSDGAFFSAELLIRLRLAGVAISDQCSVIESDRPFFTSTEPTTNVAIYEPTKVIILLKFFNLLLLLGNSN